MADVITRADVCPQCTLIGVPIEGSNRFRCAFAHEWENQ